MNLTLSALYYCIYTTLTQGAYLMGTKLQNLYAYP